MPLKKLSGADAGCWVDNARGIHMPSVIIGIAEDEGYQISKDLQKHLMSKITRSHPILNDRDGLIDNWEFVHEEAQGAEDWMNDNVAPKGYYFGYHPDWGDWGLYSTLMDRMIGDLAGVGPVALEDFLDYMRELMPTAMVQYNRKLYFLQEILKDESRKGFPDFVDIVEENEGRDENKYSVTVKRA